ncbi:MAG: putative transporter [Candidatus Omnitrophica bacterium]|nr:putative transporter [Candidatus Omnitrophota bacterium]
MHFLNELLFGNTTAHAVLILAAVIASGLVLGHVKVRGVQLGIAGVLFSGLIAGHFRFQIQPETAEFVREFGLILFVYTIGLQVGPGFFSSLRHNGLQLNLIAAWVVFCGAMIAAGLHLFAGISLPAVVGMFAGASTNTPSLAAAQQTLKELPGMTPETLNLSSLGYAACYPFGIVGIILTMLFVRRIFKLNPAAEAVKYQKENEKNKSALEVRDFRIENVNLQGCGVDQVPLPAGGVVISRVMHAGKMEVVRPDTRLSVGDVVRVVGPAEHFESLGLILGSQVKGEWTSATDAMRVQRVMVTRHSIAGKRIEDLDAFLYGVAVTRIIRQELEFAALPEIEIQLADTLVVVGEEQGIARFSAVVGNSLRHLERPQLIPVFVGIVLGVIVGSWPISLPGVPAPLRLGLAGGPLLVSILLSRIGRIGSLFWYMPPSANLMLREVGIALFLACVGLRSGGQFVHTLASGQGVVWLIGGALITLIPLLTAALWLHLVNKANYLTICGLLSGSMTDPPALAFANQQAQSSAQVVAYAAVYPLVMILRVIAAQVLILVLAGRT